MSEPKCADDLMITLDQYPHLPYWFTLRQAIAELEQSELDIKGRRSLPRVVLVFDEKHRLLGTVRRRDILRGLEPSFLASGSSPERAPLGAERVRGSEEEVFEAIRERAEHQVREVMRPIVATVPHDAPLMKLIYQMVSNDQHLLPVLKEGSVVGVVRTVDVFREIAQHLL